MATLLAPCPSSSRLNDHTMIILEYPESFLNVDLRKEDHLVWAVISPQRKRPDWTR